MLYIVRVHEDGQVYEYEYGLLEHAREHMRQERCHAELFLYREGREWFMEAVN
jgi:hypothetical protein